MTDERAMTLRAAAAPAGRPCEVLRCEGLAAVLRG